MSDVLADTNVVIWQFSDPHRLSAPAVVAIQAAARTGTIFVATMTVVELTYLIERGRFPASLLTELLDAVADPNEPFDLLPLTPEVAVALARIPRNVVGDMPDRVIAATALAHGLPLVTADRKIRGLAVPGLSIIW